MRETDLVFERDLFDGFFATDSESMMRGMVMGLKFECWR